MSATLKIAAPASTALAPVATPAPHVDELTLGATPIVEKAKINLDDPRTHTLRIRLLTTANPKKMGSASRFRYEIYRDGMTVAQYVNDPRFDKRTLRADLHWDSAHGFIRFELPDGTPFTSFPKV